MAKYIVKAYGDEERDLPTKYATVEARDRNHALEKGWEIFPEYEDLWITEVIK